MGGNGDGCDGDYGVPLLLMLCGVVVKNGGVMW